jgi:hypothetical protein
MNPADAVAHLLMPEVDAWNAFRPSAAQAYSRLLARNPVEFSRGSMALVADWLANNAGRDAPFVRSVGDAHHRRFTTHAHGRVRPDGRPAVGFGIAHSDHQHPAPWHWDLVRLLASVVTTRTFSRRALQSLAATLCSEYLRILVRIADDDGAEAVRIDLNGLPEPLKRVIEKESTAEAFDTHLARYCTGGPASPHLRTSRQSGGDAQASRLLAGQMTALLQGHPTFERTPIPVVRLANPNPLAIDQQCWLALLRERHRSGLCAPRLVAIRERQRSALARLLPVNPFPLRAALATVSAPDPGEHTFMAAGRSFQTTSFSHARHTPSLVAIDDGDLIRLARLWGQLLAGAHANGLAALGVQAVAQIEVIQADARLRQDALAGQAGDLARFTNRAHGAWVKMRVPAGGTRRG